MTSHLEILVEEPSMEAFLRALLPRLLPAGRTFEVFSFQGKLDLLQKLETRLRGYSAWLPAGWRIVVVVDRDDDDCHVLKNQLETIAERAGLRTKSRGVALDWQVANRIAVEELEAWYFGDWAAVREVYPGVSPRIHARRPYRDPDAITGGTWEAFERVLQLRGYHKGGLAKIEAARRIGAHVAPERSRSVSFNVFWQCISEAVE
jgi:hypothetical protein